MIKLVKDCKHAKVKWSLGFNAGTCQDCGMPMGEGNPSAAFVPLSSRIPGHGAEILVGVNGLVFLAMYTNARAQAERWIHRILIPSTPDMELILKCHDSRAVFWMYKPKVPVYEVEYRHTYLLPWFVFDPLPEGALDDTQLFTEIPKDNLQ